MPTVNWGSSSITTSTTQAVYARRRWSDSWVLIDALWAVERSWSLLPSIPTATLIYDYGRMLPHNAGPSSSWLNKSKLDVDGWYVKIVDTCADGAVTWVGYIDEIGDEQGGTIGTGPSGIATGRQTFVAYSVAQILAHEVITRTRWNDVENSVDRWAGSAGTFNANGKGNKRLANDEGFVFDYGHLSHEMGTFWTSKDICEYLFRYAKPLDKDGNEKLKFRLDSSDLIPNWDRPTVECEGRSVLQVLTDLINPSRMLQLSTFLDESTTPDTIVLKVHSLSSTTLTLPNGETHPANADTLNILTADAIDTYITTQGSISSRVDQVVVKGARRETVCSGNIQENDGSAGGDYDYFVELFSSSVVTAYEAAASGTSNYSTLSSSERRRKNEMVRSRESIQDAYRVFTISDKNALENTDDSTYLFEEDDNTRYYPWWGETRILPRLPFKKGVDYSGTIIADNSHDDEEKPDDFRAPVVFFEKPASSPAFFIRAEKLANSNNDPSFSVAVGLEYDSKAFTLDVQGAEQHAIAHGRFTALADDRTTTELGSWSYLSTGAACTFAIQEDRFAEGRYPNNDDLPSLLDVIRRKVIYAGPSYKLARVMNLTALDVDNDGAGVLTSSTAYLRDDREKLQALAQLAGSWYLTTRKVCRLISSRPSAVPSVGQLLATINSGSAHADTINTIVSEIRLSSPLAEGGAAQSAQYSLTTAMGELDPLAFSPEPRTVEPGFQAIPVDAIR